MEYVYKLTENDIKVLGLDHADYVKIEYANRTFEAKKTGNYFAVQNGWTCKVEGIYGSVEKEGIMYHYSLVEGNMVTEKHADYVIANCERKEG